MHVDTGSVHGLHFEVVFSFGSVCWDHHVDGKVNGTLASCRNFGGPDHGLIAFANQKQLSLGNAIRIGHAPGHIDGCAGGPDLLFSFPLRGVYTAYRRQLKQWQMVVFDVQLKQDVVRSIALGIDDGDE